MNVSGSRDKTSYISVRTCQTHSIIRNFQSYLATGSAKIPYIVCVKTSKPDPTSTRKLSSMWFKAHSRGFELFVYWIFSEIGSKKLQPQENYPKDKMYVENYLLDGTSVRARPSGFESNLENTQANCLFSRKKIDLL